jgi:hypothetical protein
MGTDLLEFFRVNFRCGGFPMSSKVKSFLESFDSLTAPEQQEVAAAILKRTAVWGSPPLTDEELVISAEEAFLQYDAEEAANESSPAR